jgi:hypothetical protein
MNPEPFVIVNSFSEISGKKTIGKIRNFIALNTVDPLKATQSLKIGKVSDEIMDKLQTVINSLEKEKNLVKNLPMESDKDDIMSSNKKLSKKRKSDSISRELETPIKSVHDSTDREKSTKKKKSKHKKD